MILMIDILCRRTELIATAYCISIAVYISSIVINVSIQIIKDYPAAAREDTANYIKPQLT